MDRVNLLHLEGNIIDYDVKNIILDIDNCVFDIKKQKTELIIKEKLP